MKSTKPGVPFSYIRWRPESEAYKTHNIFTTVNSDGEIQTWHLLSGKCLSTMKDESKNYPDKQLYCVDYNSDGSKLAVCGS
jgi:COMPASS component SWD3